MPMWIILGVCAAVFVLVIAFAGAQGAFDGGMDDEETDVPPAQRLTNDAGAGDIAALRFTPTLWGYRPAEVDDALSRLQARIAVQDARLAALGAQVTGQPPEPGTEPTDRGAESSTRPSAATGSGAATFFHDL
ncbi:DivIVA domain-containing protein [Brevibacterium jeotgali]|uniref:DivIVA domain-containing protein n=1 Tax=Brevibacterium jeotgali TaxID=1262550 RepID=A0A2H1L7S6_9MICO|nr:DivIVA domain-containing protein [Brevibacterium jeotgali]TWC03295.1 DivIVA domain-containing protein [Brevibacterium jeotgali]SMY12954.1 DivIVA domain-containing protein [Brevibacterium jeotgali]